MNIDFNVWINSDKNLYQLIEDIESKDLTVIQKAELGFEKLCALYNIPRMPSDIKYPQDNGDEYIEPRSLFEEHAYIKFLADANDDPRGLVLSAVYHILNDYQIDLRYIAKKEYGKKVPKECLIALKGEGFHGEVVFPEKEGKSWIDLGCSKMTLHIKK